MNEVDKAIRFWAAINAVLEVFKSELTRDETMLLFRLTRKNKLLLSDWLEDDEDQDLDKLLARLFSELNDFQGGESFIV